MRAYIIGIAGPSGSGKSELSRQLVARLPGSAIVTLDSYYRHCPELSYEERAAINFDHPDSIEWELLREHLAAIAEGRGFDEPTYSCATMLRTSGTNRIEPRDVLIVEGIFALYWAALRDMLDTKVYVQADPDVCFQRRLKRDVAERGRTPESIYLQYERTVTPSAKLYVHPTAAHADLIVSGEEPLERSTSAVIEAMHHSRAAGLR